MRKFLHLKNRGACRSLFTQTPCFDFSHAFSPSTKTLRTRRSGTIAGSWSQTGHDDRVLSVSTGGGLIWCMNEAELAGRHSGHGALAWWLRRLTEKLALLHNSFDYPLQTESESIDQFRAYASPTPFASEGVPTHVRPDGYGVLGHPMLHSIQWPGAKTLRCSSHPGAQDVPP